MLQVTTPGNVVRYSSTCPAGDGDVLPAQRLHVALGQQVSLLESARENAPRSVHAGDLEHQGHRLHLAVRLRALDKWNAGLGGDIAVT